MSETQDQTVSAAPVVHAETAVVLNDSKEMKFRFRKDKLGNQRAAVVLSAVPVPNLNGLIQLINDGIDPATGKPNKAVEMILDNMYDTVRAAVAAWVSDTETASQATFDPSAFSWEAIANQPREDRRANQIPDEDWQAFAADYIETMPAVTGKSKDNVTNATIVYLKKFAQVKTDKKVLALLKDQLALYMNNSKNAENFSEILELLNKKLETYLSSDDIQQLVANL